MTDTHKLLVLGANSFAGGCLVKTAVNAGMNVLGLSRSAEKPPQLHSTGILPAGKYRFLQRDINQDTDTVFRDIADFQPDYVVDLAGQGMVAESWQAPEQWYQTNIVSKARVLDHLRRVPSLKRYVRVSTPEVYGSTDTPVDESTIYRPSTPYAVSHAAIDMHVMTYVNQYGFPAVLTRFSNFYGVGQQLYRIIPRTIIYARLGRKLPLHGGGHSTRAFIYGDDIGSALLAALDRGKVGDIYHFSTDSFITIRRLVERIYSLLDMDFHANVEIADDRPGKDLRYLMRDQKARDELGWRDAVSLDDGLRQTIAWIDANWDSILQQPLDYIHQP